MAHALQNADRRRLFVIDGFDVKELEGEARSDQPDVFFFPGLGEHRTLGVNAFVERPAAAEVSAALARSWTF